VAMAVCVLLTRWHDTQPQPDMSYLLLRSLLRFG
jgi:hypothetical protein